MSIRVRHYLEISGIFFCSLLLFTIGLRTQEVTGFDSRFYLFAREMLQYGVSWFPMTYEQFYPDYPAASTFLIYLSAKLAGGLDKFTAVLPSAIAGAMTVTLTYLIGSLREKRLGLYAVLFLWMTAMFLKSGRSIALDMYPTLVTTGCFYLLYAAEVKNTSPRTFWLYLMLVTGFIFRGPIGLVMPAGVVCVYYWMMGRVASTVLFGLSALSLLLLCGALLLWLAYLSGGTVFMHEVLRMQVVGRLDHHAAPIYFYFTDGMLAYALSLPAAWLVMAGFRSWRRLPAQDALMLARLSGWALVIMMGMSVPGVKKIRYILPMIPAAALLAAYPLAGVDGGRYLSVLRNGLIRLFLFLPALCLLAVEALYFYLKKQGLSPDLPYGLAAAMLVLLQVLSLTAHYRYWPRLVLRHTLTMLFAAASFIVTTLLIVEPLELYTDQARDLVTAIERQRIEAGASLYFYRENPDNMPIKYRLNMPVLEQPIFIKDESALAVVSAPAFVIMREEYFSRLAPDIIRHFHIVAHADLGHVKVVVLTVNSQGKS